MKSANVVRSSEEKTLQQFLSNQDYMLCAGRNLRSYCWDTNRAMKLIQRIVDMEGDENLELGTILLTWTKESNLSEVEIEAAKRNASFYDVQDGQQRVTTICIFLAVMRDKITACRSTRKLEEDVKSAQDTIYMYLAPNRRGDVRLPRIAVHQREGGYLKQLLMPEESNAENGQDHDDDDDDDEDGSPTKKLKMGLSEAEERMKAVYDKVQELLCDVDLDQLLRLLQRTEERVKVIVEVFDDEKRARKLILSSRHSLNIEPVDYCKGFVCRNTEDAREEKDQSRMEMSWHELSKATSRTSLQDGCFFLAQIETGKLLPNGSFEEASLIDMFETFANDAITKDDNKSAANVFEKVWLMVKMLHNFRQKKNELYDDYSDDDKARLVPSLRFLQTASTVATGNFIEVLVLAALLLLNDNHAELVSYIQSLESVALWMIVSKPRPKERLSRAFNILKELKALASGPDARGPAIELSSKEKLDVRKALMLGEFNEKGKLNKIPRGILERLNLHLLYSTMRLPKETMITDESFYLDVILTGTESKKHLLGNLVVTETMPSKRMDKQQRFQADFRLPLTLFVGNDTPWTSQTCEENLDQIMTAADELWGLQEAHAAE